jgi:DNA-binding response OmpR family regulator
MDGSPIRVLLVDDDESFAGVIADGLREEFQFDVTVCYNGREAVELLKSTRGGFDVMVLDFMMPEMSGIEVLRWMHEDKNETPTVMLTAAGSETVAVEAMKLGAYDYARKELTDLYHLANLIRATHERHLFRVAKTFEEESAREMALNREATDKVRDVINAITPSLNSAFANISADLETRITDFLKSLPVERQRELRSIIGDIQRQVGVLESGTRGLLALYQLVYARHPEVREIERIKQSFEEQIKSPKS